MADTEYPTILKAENENSYEEAVVFLRGLAASSVQKNGKRYYSLENGTLPQIRADASKKTIELAATVNSEVIALVQNALNTKKKGEFANIFKS